MFTIEQIHKDPRSGGDFTTQYEAHDTLAQAKAAARKLKGRWHIVETRVVAQSKEEE